MCAVVSLKAAISAVCGWWKPGEAADHIETQTHAHSEEAAWFIYNYASTGWMMITACVICSLCVTVTTDLYLLLLQCTQCWWTVACASYKLPFMLLHHLLASDSGIKESNTPFFRSSVVDKEKMRPGHWFESVLVYFLQCFDTVGWVTGKTSSTNNNLWHLSTNVLDKENRLTQIHLKNRP